MGTTPEHIPSVVARSQRNPYWPWSCIQAHGLSFTPKTKDNLIACLAESGRLESILMMAVLTPASLVIPHIYLWLPSLSRISTLTLVWTSSLWAQPSSLVELFSALPPNLAILVIRIPPFADDDIATSNFDNIVTLNKPRHRAIDVRLLIQVDTARKQQIQKKYTSLNSSNHVNAARDNDPLVKFGALMVTPQGSDVMATHHPYWPSWVPLREAERCRLERVVPEDTK